MIWVNKLCKNGDIVKECPACCLHPSAKVCKLCHHIFGITPISVMMPVEGIKFIVRAVCVMAEACYTQSYSYRCNSKVCLHMKSHTDVVLYIFILAFLYHSIISHHINMCLFGLPMSF